MKSMYVKNNNNKININTKDANTNNMESNNSDSNTNTNNTYSNIKIEKSRFEVVNPIIDNSNITNINHKKILNIISKKNMTNDDKEQLGIIILIINIIL